MRSKHAASSCKNARGLRRRLVSYAAFTSNHACVNFLYVKLDYDPAPLCAFLLERKILLRDCSRWVGLEQPSVRVAVRTREENERLVRRLEPVSMRTLIAALLAVSTLVAAPQRIVSAAPSITETLFALGLGDRVVGVTEYCHYPPEARKKPKIGGFLQQNLEVVVALKPDLVIVEGSVSHLAAQVRPLKIPTLEVDFRTLPGILDSMQKIADAAGVPERGRALRDSIDNSFDSIRRQVASLGRPKLMFVVGRTPGTLTGLIVVGGKPYLNELIEIGGGVNAFRDADARLSESAHGGSDRS